MMQNDFMIKVLPKPEWILQFNINAQTDTLASQENAMLFFKTNSLAHISPRNELQLNEICMHSSEAFKRICHSETLTMPAHNSTIPVRAWLSRSLSLFRQNADSQN